MKRDSVWLDLFAGAGGTSTGLALAFERLGQRGRVRLTAINHWPTAIETHAQNHPWAEHIEAELEENTNPRTLIPKGSIDGLVAAPECTEHSIAKGNKEINDQRRASAMSVLRFVECLRPKLLLIENVKQFRDWGPVHPVTKRKIKSRSGEIYRSYLGMLRAFGYTIEERILNCANYGDATTRSRLFIMGRLGKRQPLWPAPTHDEAGHSLFGERLPWRTAEEIVTLSDIGESIFAPNRELCARTIERILAGIEKFCTAEFKPFIVMLRNHGSALALTSPIPAITAAGMHHMLCQPLIIPQHAPGRVRPIQEPMPTITATSRGIGLAQYVFKYYSTGGVRSLQRPVDTITTKDRFGLVTAGGIQGEIDIRYRMFRPRELARAHSFPEDYRFSGTKTDQVRQIGNSVPVSTATELTAAMLADWMGYSQPDIREAVLG